MNKLTTLMLLLLSPLVMAQEKQIWACQQVKGTMLNWENGNWNQRSINPAPLLLTIDGDNSNYKRADVERILNCSKILSRFSCLDTIRSEHLYIDPATGKMGVSTLYGAILTGDTRDTVSAQVYNCTKF